MRVVQPQIAVYRLRYSVTHAKLNICFLTFFICFWEEITRLKNRQKEGNRVRSYPVLRYLTLVVTCNY